jgi:hypothetical protein
VINVAAKYKRKVGITGQYGECLKVSAELGYMKIPNVF